MKTVNLLNAVLSHLTDAQDWLNYSPEAARKEINIAKAILLYIADEKTDIGKIRVETEEINKVLEKLNLIKK